ncbi:MAG: L-histidine N(alpha)-methyltransferase [Candidatus Syntrophosphaera sp.]|nr:L-histidine N(alpha)-methyltransferase [Candidatus Syntrophosphaera sp.]
MVLYMMHCKENLEICSDQIVIEDYLQELDISTIRNDIILGLSAQDKHISSKYFYDEKGSALFEKITLLPEYYPAHCEKEILRKLDISFIPDFKDLNIWELGSGDHTKISLIIDRIPVRHQNSLIYHPVDISRSAMQLAAIKLLEIYPDIRICGIVADFMHQLDVISHGSNCLLCFLGGTIGNFTLQERSDFLANMHHIMNDGDFFLLGVDTVKSRQVLYDAYNDKQGITAAFNLNILNVVNTLCKTDFNSEDFEHIALFNEDKKRIEMYLEARTDILVKSPFTPNEIKIRKGERIHTENSHKFDDEMIMQMVETSGFRVSKVFSDDNAWFKVILFHKA